ncbi:MAG: amino acid ABC transporter ATP-binding protein [Candidatus Berkiella sp.]
MTLQNPDHFLKIEQLSKWFDSFQVLKNINLNVDRQEKVVICGPSGSGKSTLIRCINGLESHQAGHIIVDGVELTSSTKTQLKIREKVGMVFQSFNLFNHLTILDNLTLAPMWVKKVKKKIAEQNAMHFLEMVKIAEQAHKYPSELSGGQQQRAAIARSLCMEPQMMLFDEPTSALDPEMIKEVLDVMTNLAQQGMTMICVTHEMAFARNIADRIVFMEAGEIIEVNTPANFFTEPKTERAKQFLSQILHHTDIVN